MVRPALASLSCFISHASEATDKVGVGTARPHIRPPPRPPGPSGLDPETRNPKLETRPTCARLAAWGSTRRGV